jgi:ABC-type sugar transport system permease subunit
MAPALISIFVWAYLPLLRGLIMAFQDYKIVLGAHWIGLDNFIDVCTAPTFWIGIGNAFLYTFYSLALGFFVPIILAILLNEIPRGTLFFRFLFYLPAITASLVVSLLWDIFESGAPNGMLNQIIGVMHLPPQNWLGDPHWAMLGVVLPAVWSTAGPGCILYLAALKSVPDEFYEAADIDGAGVWTKIWSVSLPQLRPLILIQLIGAVIAAFQVTDRIVAMTGGGPLYATHTIGYEIWENAFLYLKFGYATAAAWMMGSLLIGFTLVQLRAMRNLRFSAARS